MAVKNFPCKNCVHREIGCHSYCEDYNRAKADYEEEKEYEHRLRDVDKFMIESNIRLSNIYKKTNFRNNHTND